MSADDLAAELLTTVLGADPLTGSLYGIPGYDDLLPDYGADAEQEYARALASVAERAEQMQDTGLNETELQTLDFVRHLARGMADAAAIPLIEFTICDTFVAPVGAVLTALRQLPLDTEERRDGYLTRLRGVPDLLRTTAQRQRDGTAAGRTAVVRLVQSAIAQLELMIADPTVGALARTDVDDETLARHHRDGTARAPRTDRLQGGAPRRRAAGGP
jgi:uncharacterized protein (DUF885 family)